MFIGLGKLIFLELSNYGRFNIFSRKKVKRVPKHLIFTTGKFQNQKIRVQTYKFRWNHQKGSDVDLLNYFFLAHIFFEELSDRSPITWSIIKQRYTLLLKNKIVPHLQTRECLSSTRFVQDRALPHTNRFVMNILKRHFTEERVISRHFPDPWPPDINLCDFSHWWNWNIWKVVIIQELYMIFEQMCY